MIIWLAMAVPLVAAVVLCLYYHHKMVWWEFLLPFGVSVILIVTFKWSIEKIQVTDTEYWGGWAVRAEYDEAWTEQCTRIVTDSKGRTRTETYLVYHPAEYRVIDSNDVSVSIDWPCFKGFCEKFGNKTFKNLARMNQVGWGGDRYIATWDEKDAATFTPVITTHGYENRVPVSSSLFRYDDVSDEDKKAYELFDYPEIKEYYQCPSILGDGGPTQSEAERLLTIANAKLGKKKEVRLWILVFKNQPLQAGFLQQNLWQGGNKNEFILAIGTDNDGKVTWCHPISWTEQESLKVEARNAALDQKGQPLDLVKVVNWLTPQIDGRFVPKDFEEFSYLTVEPPLWAVLLTYLVTIAVNCGVSYWVIHNEHEPCL